MDARQAMQNHIVWQLGNGSGCKAFGHPWHGLWLQVKASSVQQSRLQVSELINQDGGWDNERLIREFGFATALYIAISVKPPSISSTREDRIIFSYAKNGQFTLKKAYQLIAATPDITVFQPEVLKVIWHTQGLLPRIRLFLWKTMHNSLPLGDILGRRISNASRPCELCGSQAETISHALFTCPWARTLWIASSLGLPTEQLPENVTDLLTAIFSAMDENGARLIANHLWAMWKLRCTEVYEGKKATPQQFLSLAESYNRLQLQAGLASIRNSNSATSQSHDGSVTCQVDGSLSSPDMAGWAYILGDEDDGLLQYGLQSGALSSPLHAEVRAMHHAVMAVSKRGVHECVFFTDCASLNLVINNSLQADQLDWRVYHDSLDVIYMFKINTGFKCEHVPREQLDTVDRLAKFARQNRVSYEGFTFPIFHPSTV
ncbi:hypothetical protein LUZ63_012216 [Rhynchospora breviuscula]|uniref:Reverse transcriptase zinc-binding domain-containing protein n=1 Tax=Rhynchospora breviuscula TaxID=2022672 RepID=A0A9Q0HRR3_9POAL|nr:hypothetical protein LUZ63_012216 [Rhynchospora breviuscula]